MTNAVVRIGEQDVGVGQRVFVVAEIGINHNGSLEIAKKLIDGAVLAGCDAVKFQKRTPEICVPRNQWDIQRDTPWGRLSYIEYRRKMEFGEAEFKEIDRYCKERKVLWFASCWDEPSVEFMERFAPPCYKSASASLTDLQLLRAMKATGRPLMMSTGMSTTQEIERAVESVGQDKLLIAHSTSTYPCPPEQLNLRMIHTLQDKYPNCPIGYSGHEVGLAPSWAAVAMGATFVEPTSRWIARCGARIRRRAWRSWGSCASSRISAISNDRWETGSSASKKGRSPRERSSAAFVPTRRTACIPRPANK